jgi:glutathione synthase
VFGAGGEMRSLFVMDPLDRINVRGDSTYVTMRECTDRGFETAYCTPDDLFSHHGRAWGRVRPVRTTREAPHFHVSGPEEVDLGTFDVVFMRKDPPFDMAYVFATYLLDQVRAPTRVFNDPSGLKLFSEKMWVLERWPELQPETLVTNDVAKLKQFVRSRTGRSVLKPWDGNGGRGVFVTDGADRNLGAIAETLSHEGRTYVIAQAFIPEVEQGDKRILLFDGEPVGAMLRVPQAGDFRANMHAGGEVFPCSLEPRDREICATIGPTLRESGMIFVGIDVIGSFLTEINVTSPTGIQEMNRLYGTKLEADLVDRVVAKVGRN